MIGKIFIAIFLIFADQVSKLAVIKRLHQNESVPILKDIFHITLVYNTGSAFGLLRNQTLILTFISVIAITVILFLLIRRPNFQSLVYLYLWQYALLFILCGAFGNLIDRVRLGYVIDFIDMRVWPVFNVADSLISSGVVILLYVLLKNKIVE